MSEFWTGCYGEWSRELCQFPAVLPAFFANWCYENNICTW